MRSCPGRATSLASLDLKGCFGLWNSGTTTGGGLQTENGVFQGYVIAGYITAGANGQVVIVTDPSLGVSLTTQVNNGLIVGGPLPRLAAGRISIGSTVPATATAGGTQAVPATVFGYIEAFVGGIAVKIPYFQP